MGLFDFLMGTDSAASEGNEATGPSIIKGQDSSFPLVFIRRLKPHTNGSHLQLYCHIVNDWPQEVELDKIRIFDTKRELDTILSTHEEREFLIYDGPTLTREYHEAQLDYKTKKEGDYFQTVHTITFAYNAPTKTYLPSDAHVHGPVRDIYEPM
jgi:hypothetical protein